MPDLPLPPPIHRLRALNIAATSENKIHDDTVASRFGFEGGLVPGVAVFGYMAHAPVARWGRAWLERGVGDCRFDAPVYDGHEALVHAARNGDDALTVTITSDGRRCAQGRASLPAAAEAAPAATAWAHRAPPAVRPPADERSLAAGTVLCSAPLALTDDFHAAWLADLRETEGLYGREFVGHPSLLLKLANSALVDNVVLGPWIHVGSTVRNHAPMPLGTTLEARGVVTREYAHKGHRFVKLDLVVLIDGARVAARVAHTAIHRPRQVAERTTAPPA